MSEARSGQRGMVSSSHPLASAAGAKVLRSGGNAVDAAVATSLVLGVVAPAFSGMGGGGFMMVRPRDQDTLYIDYRETAPGATTPGMFPVDEGGLGAGFENSMGHRSVGVPGTAAGLTLALERYGTMKFKDVASEAVRLARDGFEISVGMGAILSKNIDNAVTKLRRFSESGKEWMKDGRPYRTGETKVSAEFARSIQSVARDGRDGFYSGAIARAIATEMSRAGGLLTESDLHGYRVEVRKPVKGEYRGIEVHAAPPPSLGGIALIQTLNILEDTDIRGMGLNTPDGIAAVADALSVVWPDVRARVADPAFVKADTDRLTSKDYAAKLWFSRGERGAEAAGRHCTTHLSVVDGAGGVAAITESLECYFGSGVTAPGTGFFLNDTMHDFDAAPGRVNSVAPKKRPASNMTPTLLLKDGEPFLVAGSAGGPRIVTATLQTILNIVDHSLDAQQAVDAPRFHFNGSGPLKVESRIRAPVLAHLRKMGFTTDVPNYLQLKPGFDVYFGGVNTVMVGKARRLTGGADPRRLGSVASC